MMKKLIGLCALAIVFSAASAPVAKADGVDSFTYQSNGNTFVWRLPASPFPGNSNVSPGLSFTLNNVSVSENGAAPVLATFDFFTLLDGGGFDLTLGKAMPINAFGLAVFNGSLNSPTFLTGKFLLLDFGTGDDGSLGKLAVTHVPEPSSVGLLAIGFLLVACVFTFKRANGLQIQS
ncbi:MAG TPA: PEP-CTERM sorting domain-containing protein [Candidatus Acidoferrum sp.]